MYGITAYNKRFTLRRLRRLGFRKTAVGLAPFVRFCSTTFGAGVIAAQCPITCPKRRKPRTLSASFLNLFRKTFDKIIVFVYIVINMPCGIIINSRIDLERNWRIL